MSAHNNPPEISFDDPARHGMTQRVTWISVVVNVFLTAAQVVAGIIANSQGLIADGMHSLSDLVCDFLVLFAAHHSKDPADEAIHTAMHGSKRRPRSPSGRSWR